jgi:hypothetical protein
MLEPTMKAPAWMIAGLLLAACAGPTYYPAQPSGEGSYYIARSPGTIPMAPADAAYYYGTWSAYGVYPWWGYPYYSPYFYPHYFSIWQPGWPYYGSSPGGWYGYHPHRFSYGRPIPQRPPQQLPADPEAPAAGGPVRPVSQPPLYRDVARQGGPRWQSGPEPAEHRPDQRARSVPTMPAGRLFDPPGSAAPPPTPSGPAGMAGQSRDPLQRKPSQRDP